MNVIDMVNVVCLGETVVIYEESLEEYVEMTSGRRIYRKNLVFSGLCKEVPYEFWNAHILRVRNEDGRIRIDI